MATRRPLLGAEPGVLARLTGTAHAFEQEGTSNLCVFNTALASSLECFTRTGRTRVACVANGAAHARGATNDVARFSVGLLGSCDTGLASFRVTRFRIENVAELSCLGVTRCAEKTELFALGATCRSCVAVHSREGKAALAVEVDAGIIDRIALRRGADTGYSVTDQTPSAVVVVETRATGQAIALAGAIDANSIYALLTRLTGIAGRFLGRAKPAVSSATGIAVEALCTHLGAIAGTTGSDRSFKQSITLFDKVEIKVQAVRGLDRCFAGRDQGAWAQGDAAVSEIRRIAILTDLRNCGGIGEASCERSELG